MLVHDTQAAGWDLGLDSSPGNGLELSITLHETYTTRKLDLQLTLKKHLQIY